MVFALVKDGGIRVEPLFDESGGIRVKRGEKGARSGATTATATTAPSVALEGRRSELEAKLT